jgi:hypothetical protein
VLIETLLKKITWVKIIDSQRGLRHPRLYAAADVFFSAYSAVTGPIKTVVRVLGAMCGLFMQLFRSDATMMLDKSLYLLDPHFTASTGMLMGLRVSFEFSKIRQFSGHGGGVELEMTATPDGSQYAEAGVDGGDEVATVANPATNGVALTGHVTDEPDQPREASIFDD